MTELTPIGEPAFEWEDLMDGHAFLQDVLVSGESAWSNGCIMEIGVSDPFPVSIKKAVEHRDFEPVIKWALQSATKPLTPIGCYENMVVLAVGVGNDIRIYLNKSFYGYFAKRYPEAIFWGSWPTNVVVVKKGDKAVGVMMPVWVERRKRPCVGL